MANDKTYNLGELNEVRNLVKEINFYRQQEQDSGEKITGQQKLFIQNAEKMVEKWNEITEGSEVQKENTKVIINYEKTFRFEV